MNVFFSRECGYFFASVFSFCGTFLLIIISNRSSRPEGFCKKGFLRNFTKFTGKHLCQSLFFNKVAGLRPATLLKKRLWHRCFPVNFVKFLRPATLLKKRLWHRCFPVNFVKFLRASFLEERLRWLLLK